MEIFSNFSTSVLHGGTAIWRCYNGNRFSEDIYVYLEKNEEEIENFIESLKKKKIEILRFKETKNSIFSKLSFQNTEVRFEATYKKIETFTIEKFEMLDGNFLLVRVLPKEKLLEEKILAYAKRRKVRDLYDVYYLSKIVDLNKIDKKILKLVEGFRKPEDEENLKAIILFGSVPSSDFMLEEVRKWVEKSI